LIAHKFKRFKTREIPTKDYSLFLFQEWLALGQSDYALKHAVDRQLRELEGAMSLAESSVYGLPESAKLTPSAKILDAIGSAPGAATYARRALVMEKIHAVSAHIWDNILAGYYRKVVVLGTHFCAINHLQLSLRGLGVVAIYRNSKRMIVAGACKHFHSKGRVFLAQIDSAINNNVDLSCADTVIMVDPEWVITKNCQAIYKCHKGNDLTVFWPIGYGIDNRVTEIVRRQTIKQLNKLESQRC
jgi:hypothetical protein